MFKRILSWFFTAEEVAEDIKARSQFKSVEALMGASWND